MQARYDDTPSDHEAKNLRDSPLCGRRWDYTLYCLLLYNMAAQPGRQEAYCTVSYKKSPPQRKDELTQTQLLLSDGYLPGNQKVRTG